MTRIFITYGLILLSSFLVYWLYEMMTADTSDSSWVLNLGFLSSIFHFGISSWVFLKFARTGRVLSIISAVILCVWPLTVIFQSAAGKNFETAAVFTVPVILSCFVIRNQIKTFLSKERPDSFIRALMMIIPPGIVIAYEIYGWNFVYER